MTSYNPSIPAANNNPSADQSPMQQNFSAIYTWTGVDHYALNNADYYGWHQQVTFPVEVAQDSQIDPSSVLYTAAGATSTHANLFYKNVDGTFPISGVRAFGCISSAGAVVGNASNLTSAQVSTGVYTVTLSANAVATANAIVLVSVADAGNTCATYGTSYTSGVLTITVYIWVTNASGSHANRAFSIAVLQM